jgi:hypothetical protein
MVLDENMLTRNQVNERMKKNENVRENAAGWAEEEGGRRAKIHRRHIVPLYSRPWATPLTLAMVFSWRVPTEAVKASESCTSYHIPSNETRELSNSLLARGDEPSGVG